MLDLDKLRGMEPMTYLNEFGTPRVSDDYPYQGDWTKVIRQLHYLEHTALPWFIEEVERLEEKANQAEEEVMFVEKQTKCASENKNINAEQSNIINGLWELYDRYENVEHAVCGDAAREIARLYRSVELPCKVGDTVYDKTFGGDVKVTRFVKYEDSDWLYEAEYKTEHGLKHDVHYVSRFGKTVFLSRSEAEAAKGV